MPPRTIAGRYVIERAVGHGGMGTVWLCRDEVLGRSVAVKQVGNMPGETTSDVSRALREARSSAALNHKNVVSVYDAIEDGDHNWLVMEYVESRTLADILSKEGPLAPERAAWIGAQAADGLAAAHARGTMHRDVKPGNILVTDADHVKITDFGISRTHGDDQLTRTGLITGTPSYFSPEICRGEEPGLPADVWALGATLYAAVEGHGPYPDPSNAIALLAKIAAEPAPPPQNAGLLTDPISRMMDRDPTTRWSMADAAHVLHRLHAQPVGAARPEPTPRAIPTPIPAPEPTPEPTPEPVAPDERRRPAWLLPLVGVLLLVLVTVGVVALLGRGDNGTPAADTASNGATTADASAESSPAEPTPSAPEATPSAEAPSPVGDAGAFAEQYYGFLPDDTQSAYDLLSPAYQSTTSLEQYQGFWATISAVDVRGTSDVDDATVDVDLTYTTSGGGSEDETRRLFLEEGEDGYLIVDDEVR